jgi:hypothetical protein
MTLPLAATRAVLLKRQALLFITPEADSLPHSSLEAFEVNLADIGYVVSTRLQGVLRSLPAASLTSLQEWLWPTLLDISGGDRRHQPLFRRFPEDVPADTFDLWCRKVLNRFMQEQEQPCLFCGQLATTHVLNPCRHVVCDSCFDGSNYSACPICECQVDRDSPFFRPSVAQAQPREQVRLKRLDLGGDLDASAQALFTALCLRKQAMSPADQDDLKHIIADYGVQALDWLPHEIPVRESNAILFGTLLRTVSSAQVRAAAMRSLRTATDALRLIAAYSGADPALQGQTVYRSRPTAVLRSQGRFRRMFDALARHRVPEKIDVPVLVRRFKVARLPRPLRKALLGFLDGLHPQALKEDMLRHRSYWVWLGQFLHPHEYLKRFPHAAAAFEIVRKKGSDGTPAPAFQTYYAKLEAAIRQRDAIGMLGLLRQRPGEFARRYDHLLRLASADASQTDRVIEALEQLAPQCATPVLLTLRASLPTRVRQAAARLYWPKGQVAKSVLDDDRRVPLPASAVARSVAALDMELLDRFARQPGIDHVIVDRALKNVIVPFNERTASRSAIHLPRGSTLDVPTGKTMRLFLHWCQLQEGSRTDLDLSVGFYDETWQHVGTCSYYALRFDAADGTRIATSAGDLQSAPHPDGATEFVDVDLAAARAKGIRYAVAVLNNYAGMPFEQLERAFAGLMFRDDVAGAHFDPRTVALKFALQGSNGVFLPFVVDLARNRLHWLDVYATGGLAFNNVETSNGAIATICPSMIRYFASGLRASMYDLLLYHAAARARKVSVLGDGIEQFERGENESAPDFLHRLQKEQGRQQEAVQVGAEEKTLAGLVEGEIDLPEGSQAYVVKPGRLASTLSASDLIG